MRLVDLDPRWLLKDGRRIGFAFRSPKIEKWWLTCFAAPTPHADQHEAAAQALGDVMNWLPCMETVGWTISGGIETATFETMTVMPSLDAGETLWHGFITNGQIVGGI